MVLTSGHAASYEDEIDGAGLVLLPRPYGARELADVLQRAIKAAPAESPFAA